jgi:formylglycine-generating enzyme required for sulfatase activity
MRKLKFLLIFSFFFIAITSKSNNLSISNVTYDNVTYQVSFDLSWDNSWRRDASIPFNYDGIWVFVKVRECTQKVLGNPTGYYHAWLNTNAVNHSAANSAPGGEPLTIEVGTTDIAATPRGMGVFIYRTADGGTSSISTTVTLQWDKAAQAGAMAEIGLADDYDVKVFGTEMVYIPQASYYLGDGGSNNCFHDLAGGTGTPYQVTSENSFSASGTYNREINSVAGNINANFPKGYDSFWIMKYEISQAQYAEFLNTLTYQQVENRTQDEIFSLNGKRYVMSDRADVYYRQSICFIPSGDSRTDKFGVDFNDNDIIDEVDDGGGIACNYLNLRDVMAYLDWAALRPLTELEYEKTCRGTLTPILNENVWGNGAETAVTAIINSGQPTESASNFGDGLCNYNGTTGNVPMRCGYAATNSTNRSRAGAAYYGVMDLAGNVHEPYVSFYADPTYSDEFNGSTGDGEIDINGYHDVTGWPLHTADADVSRFICKGGNSNRNQAYLRISDRRLDNGTNYRYDSPAYVTSRYVWGGGRGGR